MHLDDKIMKLDYGECHRTEDEKSKAVGVAEGSWLLYSRTFGKLRIFGN